MNMPTDMTRKIAILRPSLSAGADGVELIAAPPRSPPNSTPRPSGSITLRHKGGTRAMTIAPA